MSDRLDFVMPRGLEEALRNNSVSTVPAEGLTIPWPSGIGGGGRVGLVYDIGRYIDPSPITVRDVQVVNQIGVRDGGGLIANGVMTVQLQVPENATEAHQYFRFDGTRGTVKPDDETDIIIHPFHARAQRWEVDKNTQKRRKPLAVAMTLLNEVSGSGENVDHKSGFPMFLWQHPIFRWGSGSSYKELFVPPPKGAEISPANLPDVNSYEVVNALPRDAAIRISQPPDPQEFHTVWVYLDIAADSGNRWWEIDVPYTSVPA